MLLPRGILKGMFTRVAGCSFLALAFLSSAACSRGHEQYDTSVQITPSAAPGRVFVVAMVHAADASKTNPDVGVGTFDLAPGQTKTLNMPSKFFEGREYGFTVTIGPPQPSPLVTITSSVSQHGELVFRTKQDVVAWGFPSK